MCVGVGRYGAPGDNEMSYGLCGAIKYRGRSPRVKVHSCIVCSNVEQNSVVERRDGDVSVDACDFGAAVESCQLRMLNWMRWRESNPLIFCY